MTGSRFVRYPDDFAALEERVSAAGAACQTGPAHRDRGAKGGLKNR
jgi:hypothetical protein